MAVADNMVEATEVAQEEASYSEVVASEAPEGNTNSLVHPMTLGLVQPPSHHLHQAHLEGGKNTRRGG